MAPYQREEFDLAEHRAVVLGFVHRMLGRRELAEELTQGCLATRRAKASYLSGKRLVRTWLPNRIAQTVMILGRMRQ
ncbi:MAG TPA: hypothetical protein VIS99_11065 [Terrimicrobiaceae bacterium]